MGRDTEQNEVTGLESLARVTIARMGEITPADETNISQGLENKIVFDIIYTKTLKCIYQLQLYPFDTQECTVDLEVGEYDRNVMIIRPENLEMIGQTLLSQYSVPKWDLDYKHKGKKQNKNLRYLEYF